MKNIALLMLMLIFRTFVYSQGNPSEIYVFTSRFYYESINLLKDGTFKYYVRREFGEGEVLGNWQIRNDTILVLDSRPQRTRLLVDEARKGNTQTFRVRTMDNSLINYSICLINKSDTIVLRDQFDKTTTSGTFTSFYLIDSRGLYSPTYKIKGARTNFFDIRFEQSRVFENEYWRYYGQYIIPIGIDHRYSNYKLEKKE